MFDLCRPLTIPEGHRPAHIRGIADGEHEIADLDG
jgi:hypothetical protein